jgi:glycosyltransferase involved in cell wall biosynthesis
MDRFGIEILHTHNWYADFVGAVAKRLRPVKTMSTVYVWSDYDWKRNLLQAIDRRVLRGFDIVSAHCRDTYLKTRDYGIPEDRLRLHVAGYAGKPIDMTSGERSLLRRSRGIADDEILLGNVARFYPEKSHELLLHSFRGIVDSHPRARLWIAGVGPLESRAREQVRELELGSRVEFLGFVERLEEVLPLLDIQVHPATIEGVPQAVCAGMTAGLPVVASAVGGIPEIVEHERTGLLVPPSDEAALTEAIVRVMDDSGLRLRLGEAARDFITNEYSLSAAVRRVEQSYLEVAS